MQKASNKANIASGLMGPLMNMMNNLNYGVTAFAGGILAIYGMVSVGTIAAFLNYTRQFSRPLNQIAQLYTTIQSALAGAERVFAVLDEIPEFEDTEESLPLSTVRGEVIFKNLHFRYLPDIPIIKGIDIHANRDRPLLWSVPQEQEKQPLSIYSPGFMISIKAVLPLMGKISVILRNGI